MAKNIRLGDINDDRYNSHGYRDPTAYAVTRSLSREKERFKKLLRTIFAVCELSGFDLVGRIKLVDRRTGKTWE